MLKDYISSFRDLPVYVYQFQTKLRNELRAKSGIMRGREFIMKDLYSYSLDEKSHTDFYNAVTEAYLKIFKRAGLGEDTFVTFASGGAFTQFSHEFQTISDGGEDHIYLNREKNIAVNEEIMTDENLKNLGVKRTQLEKVKTAEVGNIFNFGTKKSEELELFYSNAEGKKIPVWLGSYGIGITRLMGVVAEKFADEKGLVWPENLAPFKLHLVMIPGAEKVAEFADKLYKELVARNIETLYDDRDVRAGEKFQDSDLIGIPKRVIISEKTLESGRIEIKDRKTGEAKMISEEELLAGKF
jgi:prolyl-tRNA synthetase